MLSAEIVTACDGDTVLQRSVGRAMNAFWAQVEQRREEAVPLAEPRDD